MGFKATLMAGFGSASGNFDSDAAGTVNAASAVETSRYEPGTLSALVTVDAETDTITLAGIWQVSNDNSTWYAVVEPYNPANVVLATGTAGADAAVTKVIQCPLAAWGWKYVRCGVVSGVAAGNTVDTYSIAYYARKSNYFIAK